jgi:hypothetical protein
MVGYELSKKKNDDISIKMAFCCTWIKRKEKIMDNVNKDKDKKKEKRKCM